MNRREAKPPDRLRANPPSTLAARVRASLTYAVGRPSGITVTLAVFGALLFTIAFSFSSRTAWAPTSGAVPTAQQARAVEPSKPSGNSTPVALGGPADSGDFHADPRCGRLPP